MGSQPRSRAALASALALALGGCGGSSGGTLSKAQLAARVNAACTSYARASLAIPQPSDLASNPSAAAAYLDQLRPLVEAEHATIAGLKPPAAVRTQFRQFSAASGHQLGLFDSARAKAHAGDRSGLRDLLTAARYKQSVMVPLERQLGFSACAK